MGVIPALTGYRLVLAWWAHYGYSFFKASRMISLQSAMTESDIILKWVFHHMGTQGSRGGAHKAMHPGALYWELLWSSVDIMLGPSRNHDEQSKAALREVSGRINKRTKQRIGNSQEEHSVRGPRRPADATVQRPP